MAAKKKAAKKAIKKAAVKAKPIKKAASVKAAKKPAAKKPAPKKPVSKKPIAKKAAAGARPARAVKKAAIKPSKAAASKKAKKAAGPAKAITHRQKKIFEIRLKLAGQKNTLLAEAESAMNILPDQTIFPDIGDQASLETDRGFLLRLKGREQRLLLKIEEALDRIERGAYGICEVCGEEIAVPRLEARPVTTMCIDCKTEQEADEKVQGS